MSSPTKRLRLANEKQVAVEREVVCDENDGAGTSRETTIKTVEELPVQLEEQIEKPDEEVDEIGKQAKEVVDHEKEPEPAVQAEDEEKDGGRTGEKCRLHSLNLHCLLHICDYLSVRELLHLHDLDDYFKSIIIDHVISNKLVDFTITGGHWTTNQIFRTFGKNMRRIKISHENTLNSYRRFLEFIIEYCTPGRLIELNIRYRTDLARNERHLVQRVQPYFRNVEKLVLNASDSTDYVEFMEVFSEAPVEIKVLHLYGVTLFRAWSQIPSFNNLVEFRMHDTSLIRRTNAQHLAEFLRTKHSLKIFDYSGRENIRNATQVLSEECKNLVVYRDLCTKEYDRSAPPLPADLYMRYSHLSTISTIKHLAISSYSNQGNDIHYTLMRLAQPSQIESLTILINKDGKDDTNDTTMITAAEKWLAALTNRSFEKLKRVELSFISETSDTHTFECDLLCKFLMVLPNLVTIRVSVDRPIRNISKILSYIPHIRRVSLTNARMIHMPVEMHKIHRSLRRIRAKQPNNKHMIHLALSSAQLNEIMVIIEIMFFCFWPIHQY